jgi:hypothetical protein
MAAARDHGAMADIRIIKHEAVPKCGCFEVRFSDGRPVAVFLLGRPARPPAEATFAPDIFFTF